MGSWSGWDGRRNVFVVGVLRTHLNVRDRPNVGWQGIPLVQTVSARQLESFEKFDFPDVRWHATLSQRDVRMLMIGARI